MDNKTYSSSIYKGSQKTVQMVKQAILERFGEEAASRYRPTENCFTFCGWLERNRVVRRGETGLKSNTILELKDEQGTTVRKMPKRITLFFIDQTEELKS